LSSELGVAAAASPARAPAEAGDGAEGAVWAVCAGEGVCAGAAGDVCDPVAEAVAGAAFCAAGAGGGPEGGAVCSVCAGGGADGAVCVGEGAAGDVCVPAAEAVAGGELCGTGAEVGAEGDVCATEAGGGVGRLGGAGAGAGASTTCEAPIVRWRVGQKNAPRARRTTLINAHNQRVTAAPMVRSFSLIKP